MTRRLLAAAGALLLATAGRAEQTRLATVTPASLQQGDADGIQVTSRGEMRIAPAVTAITKPLATGDPAQVFSLVADGGGKLILGTGPDGAVLRADAGGATSVLFRAPEPLITAVMVLPSGDVLAASAPGGKIYRIGAQGAGSVWCETGEKYVWALAAGPAGSVLAATGERGRLMKIDAAGHATVWFDSDEPHLVSIVPAADGVWVGGAGRGLVYHVDGSGRGRVVYDDDLPEAKALVVEPDGSLVAAFDAAPAPERRLPAVRFRMGGGGAASDAVGELDSRDAGSIQGVIEGLPSSGDEAEARLRGKLVRVSPRGTASEIWRSSSEGPFAAALDASGRVVFATGEPARIWRVDGPGEITLVETLKEAQGTGLLRAGGALTVATSNPAGAYRLDPGASVTGTYEVAPLDAGGVARWGTLSWRTSGRPGRVELAARTGNSESPDGSWSAWSEPLSDAAGSRLALPEGRFLQWRVRITGSGADAGSVSDVTATYATRNRAPALRDLRIEPAGGAVSGKATLRWSASDPDGDGVAVDVEAARQGATTWRVAAHADPPAAKPSDPALGNDGGSKDGRATWDTADWDEGIYVLRAVATDRASNPPGDGLSTEVALPGIVRVDRTPPTIDAKRGAGDAVDVTVKDALSTVVRVELLRDGRVVAALRPIDGLTDGPVESFRLDAADLAGGGAPSLRATDAAGNVAESPVPAK